MTGAEEAAIIVPSPEANFAAGAMQLVRLTTRLGPQLAFLCILARDVFHVFCMFSHLHKRTLSECVLPC